jgi:glycogen debranching enzyme
MSSEQLTARQHERKERILTQPEPSKTRQTENAVVLKHGAVFLLSTDGGDVPWELPHGLGLYYQDCRFLDGYVLTINGCAPVALSQIAARGYETHHDLANPEIPASNGDPSIAKNTIAVRRQRLIRGEVLYELLTVHNYGRAPARLRLEIRFRAHFEDIFVVKGFVPDSQRNVSSPQVLGRDAVRLRFQGQDGFCRTTTLVFSPAPERLDPDRAAFTCALDPGQRRELAICIVPRESRDPNPSCPAARPTTRPETLKHWLERSEDIWLARSAEVHASNPLFDRVLRRALLDLRLLRSRLDRLHYFAAGIPWFATLFGRDAATVALQTLPYGPRLARETLQLLARHQAEAIDTYRDAEPGKILHEFRTGELAQSQDIPQSPAYYGTVDATLLFLILFAEYVNWSGDLDLARELRSHVDAALGWMERYADHDGDGYLDYVGEYANGLVNQGWKDSGNAIVNADGSLAEPPIALCEVQAYAFRAWRQTAALLRALGDGARADALDRRADEMRRRFERDFWSEELGCYLLARQAGGRPAAVVTSNAGQVLWGGVAAPARAARVAKRLMAPDMFSGWGIRTLSSEAAAFNPMSYHLGSVWPHDNGLIIAGFRRYGHDEPALRVFDALFDAAADFRDFRMPELYCGSERRDDEPAPVRYPVACSPQAWAAGAIPHALWNLLGLRADALQQRLQIIRPRLPSWLDWLELHGVQVGSARADVRFERADRDGRVQAVPTIRSGELRVDQTEELPAPDSYS